MAFVFEADWFTKNFEKIPETFLAHPEYNFS